MRKVRLLILFFVLIVLGGIFIMVFIPGFGGKINGSRLERNKKSPNYKDGIFQNSVKITVQLGNGSMFKVMREFMKSGEGRKPESPIKVQPIDIAKFKNNNEGLNITWLGHSTLLIEMGGITILTDPVFSKRTSPVSFAGTKSFEYTHHYSVSDLPDIDVVLISHDHYDHLDYKTIFALKEKTKKIVTALGVGAHLEKWGIDPIKIVELDWWEEAEFLGLKFAATPGRHFSGRGLTNRFSTLWASFVIKSKNHSVFFGADSGYFPGFIDIGEKYGPFDICMLECGQYNETWPYIHMAPEETVQAHIDLKGKLLLPIHWGKFSLSLHTWTEPIERLLKKANTDGVEVTTPKIGETFEPQADVPKIAWWRDPVY